LAFITRVVSAVETLLVRANQNYRVYALRRLRKVEPTMNRARCLIQRI